jgi:hypothetical protein
MKQRREKGRGGGRAAAAITGDPGDGRSWGWSGWVGRRAAVHPVPAESPEVDGRGRRQPLRRTAVRVADELDDSGTKWLEEGVGEVYGSSLVTMVVLAWAEVD